MRAPVLAMTALWRRSKPAPGTWLAALVLLLPIFILAPRYDWLAQPPGELLLPIDEWLNAGMAVFVANFKWLFQALGFVLTQAMEGLRFLLHWLPWPATISLVALLSHVFSGLRLAIFSSAALLYMVVVGYWDETMNTLALVGVAVPLSLLVGLVVGIIGFKSLWARRVIEPLLDVMQTVPPFAYILPIILLFGFGPLVGLVGSAIYAVPPMVRNVMLGLSRVPSDIVDSARVAGTTHRQLLWWVQVPSALPTIMMGVNQTIMSALAMVIIAAIMGGSDDIGWEVLQTMRKAQFGECLLAGTVIALVAIVMDRISRAAAFRKGHSRVRQLPIWRQYPRTLIALGLLALVLPLAELFQPLRQFPEAWVFYPAHYLNDALAWFTATFFNVTDAIKQGFLFLILLPFKIGLWSSVTPHFWGISMSIPLALSYGGLLVLTAGFAGYLLSWRGAVAVIAVGTLFFFGTTGIPWPAFVLFVTVLAVQVGGWRVGLFALFGLLFILVGGTWERAMVSIALCGVGVLIAILLGGLLGIWAAHSDRVSAVLRPINDSLQTMPQFVFLIPAIMLFLLGDFSSLLAIIAYSIVPAIRYTEHGLRQVPREIIEAAQSCGCTRNQLLVYVKLPLALPELMLGLNQTVMFGLSMLVITALIGSGD